MGFLDKVLTGGGIVLVGIQAKAAYSQAQETKRRKNSPLSFIDGLTQNDFVEIARDVAKGTPRVENVVVKGVTVTLYVQSNSGLSKWTAEVDFNDYGRLTGAYWLKADRDSLVPEHFAKAVQKQVVERLSRTKTDR
jgi:hypothetical protein